MWRIWGGARIVRARFLLFFVGFLLKGWHDVKDFHPMLRRLVASQWVGGYFFSCCPRPSVLVLLLLFRSLEFREHQ